MSVGTDTTTPVDEYDEHTPETENEEDEAEDLLLTVEEAAVVLRIGRSLAYDLALRYEVSGGTAGMPNIRLSSGCRRVPRWALLELATTGHIAKLDPQLRP